MVCLTSNSAEINPVALNMVELCLAEGISQLVSRKLENLQKLVGKVNLEQLQMVWVTLKEYYI